MFNIDRKSIGVLFIGLMLTMLLEALLLSGLVITLPFDAYRFISIITVLTLIGFVLTETQFFKAMRSGSLKMDYFRGFGIIAALILLVMVILETVMNDSPRLLIMIKPWLITSVILSGIFEAFKKR